MSEWSATKARRILAALHSIRWQNQRSSGSHLTLRRQGWPDFVFSFHADAELGPRMHFEDQVLKIEAVPGIDASWTAPEPRGRIASFLGKCIEMPGRFARLSFIFILTDGRQSSG